MYYGTIHKQDVQNLRNLSRDESIVICKPDKGRGVVIVNRSDYVSSMLDIISDTSKFELLSFSFDKYTRKIEDKLNNFLHKVKDQITTSCHNIKDLFASGCAPGILYGLPKIHKPDFSSKFQFRPIFAAYNNPCYKLSKFLVPLLSPYATNEYTIDNSLSFVNSLKQFNGSADNLFMASFDIESLYTNIPLTETVEIILNYVFTEPTSLFIGLS